MWYEDFVQRQELILKTGFFKGIAGKAVFSADSEHRFFLEKRWAPEGKVFTALMMNPSNAAHDKTDDTVDQLIDVAKQQGCHALYVVNVSSYICGTSGKLNNSTFFYEKNNWDFVITAMKLANVVFIGWGVKSQIRIINQAIHNPKIMNAFQESANKIYCYDVIKSNDQKYSKTPLYYVPHPRPIPYKNTYRSVPIRLLTKQEFSKLLRMPV